MTGPCRSDGSASRLNSHDAKRWARKNGLAGSPFRRGRRTVLVLDRREPAQHSQDTHDRHYALVDKQVQDAAIPLSHKTSRSTLRNFTTSLTNATLTPPNVTSTTPDNTSIYDKNHFSLPEHCSAN